MRFPLLALSLVALGGLALADDQADKIARFKKYIADAKPEVRATTVSVLEGVDDAEATGLLIETLKDRAFNVRDEALRVLSGYRSDASVGAAEKALAGPAVGKAKPYVAMALGKMGHPSSIDPLVALAADPDWENRRAAAEALGNFKDPKAREALVALTKDTESVVRTTTADALGNAGDGSVVDAVNALLGDSAWQTRSAACAAAGKLRDKRSIVPLMTVLEEEGRLRLDAKLALTQITLFNFAADPKEWKDWWARSGDSFVVPPLNAPKGAPAGGSGAKPAPGGTALDRRYKGPGTHYYGIATPSKNMIFLLDVSKSMAEEVDKAAAIVDKGKYAETNFTSTVKMDICKAELIRTIKSLKENVKFNIVLFETEISTWKKELQPANETNKADAIAFVTKQKPRGAEIAHNNRSGGSVGQAGRTNLWDALQFAFGIAGIGTYDKSYTTQVDTIFVLTDGQPTAGKMTKPEDIEAEVKRLNGLRKVVIHTISVGKLEGPFLKRLAIDNGGTFVDLVGGEGLESPAK
jgi:HEAT repeat protein/VWA domain-containing protein